MDRDNAPLSPRLTRGGGHAAVAVQRVPAPAFAIEPNQNQPVAPIWRSFGWSLLSIPPLLWPALWNGYPIVFADSGTYLSQAMRHYLGWDRPVFYSFFMLPLHLGLTTWPVIVAQACLTVLVLHHLCRALDLAGWWLPVLCVSLSLATWLPWTVSELMPDLFTPLSILLLCLLLFSAERFSPRRRAVFVGLAAFMIATQQSSVPLALGLVAVALPARWLLTGATARPRSIAVRLTPLLAPGLAIAALVCVNTVGFGRFSLSPYGNVFVLARVIYDGPGMIVLRRDCAARGWSLCPFLDRFPATSDAFLWDKSSPIMLAGGHKAVSAQADPIIRAAMEADPGLLLAATWNNTLRQLTEFASGDGLEAWHGLVGSWIDQDFPHWEAAAFHAARQQRGVLRVPPPLAAAHQVVALAGIVAALALLPLAWRRHHVAAWYLAAALLAQPLSAAITGGLSTPHDRYQSRIIWLPACMACLAVPALAGGRRRAKG